MAAEANCLIYLLRHDLRLSDNPIFDRLASSDNNEFTHLLPVYVFPAQSVEVSGFINDGSPSPYPAAKSKVSKVWRTGPHRAKFITQCIWDLKKNLESMGSGLLIRVGKPSDVVSDLVQGLSQKQLKVGGVWITKEEGVEEREDVKAISELCVKSGAALTLFEDEKYFIDDRDVPMPIKDIPLVFTEFRKSVEPLREKPRAALPKPEQGKLPLFPKASQIPSQRSPFVIPTSYDELENAILAPVRDFLPGIGPFPEGAESAHPFSGGESSAHERLRCLIKEGLIFAYKETRNGLLGPAFSTKLSGYLSQGCITARQIHDELVKYEDGTDPEYAHAKGYNEGHEKNEGTSAVRMELLWRDYMRLCTMKHRDRLFSIDGFQHQGYGDVERKKPKWKSYVQEDALPDQDPPPEKIAAIMDRFNAGTTGQGLIDASQRELLYTGYTSNRARQNVASFLTKHLDIDWRIGAEWYELLLVDYDVSSNWGNWQYVAGVGNDPRGDNRIFNPVKQAFDYDKKGEYVKAWVPEVRALTNLENVFQVCSTSPEDLEKAGLTDNIMATDPVKRIVYTVDGKPKSNKRSSYRGPRGRGRGRGNGDWVHDDATNGRNGDVWPSRGGPFRGGGRGGYHHPPRRGHPNGRGGYPADFNGGPPSVHPNYQPYPYPAGQQPMMHPDYSRGGPMMHGQGHPLYPHPQQVFLPPQYGQTPYPPRP